MRISIKQKLDEKGMSRYELAKRIGVTYPTITSIYNEESTSIKFSILEAICRELDCSLDEILIFDDKKLHDKQAHLLAYYKVFSNIPEDKSDSD